MKTLNSAASCLLLLLMTTIVLGQTSAFNYQGRLTDAGLPASGDYQVQFTLFDAVAGGNQIGKTIADVPVTATQGVFTTELDFGVNAFSGADRFLEIAVRRNTGEPYTTLNPRQQVFSSPYSIRTISAAQADVALDSQRLGGLNASEYVTTTNVGNTFIRNATKQQTADFNISGSGTLSGTLTAGTVTAQTGTGFFGLTQTDGTTTIGTYVGGSTSGATGGWFGTQSNSPLHFFTNNGQPQMTVLPNGNVGIGTFSPQAKLHIAGNAAQDRDKSGMVKAMLYVDGNVDPTNVVRCYNGMTGISTGNCGFTVTRTSPGFYDISFGFQVSDRFISITMQNDPPPITGGPRNVGANFRFPSSNNTLVTVNTFYTGAGQNEQDAAFMLIVY